MYKNRIFKPTITPNVARLINSCTHQQKKFKIISQEQYKEIDEKTRIKNKDMLTIVIDDKGKLITSFW